MKIIVPNYLYQNGIKDDNEDLYINKLKEVYKNKEISVKNIVKHRDDLIKVYCALQIYGMPLENTGKNHGYNAKVEIMSLRQLILDMGLKYNAYTSNRIKSALVILEALELIKQHKKNKNIYFIASKFENAYKILGNDEQKYYTALEFTEAHYLIQNKIDAQLFCLIKSLYKFKKAVSKKYIEVISGYNYRTVVKEINKMCNANIIYWKDKQNFRAEFEVFSYKNWFESEEFEQ